MRRLLAIMLPAITLPAITLLAGCSTPETARPVPAASPLPVARSEPAARAVAQTPAEPRPWGTVDLDERETPLAQVIDRIAAVADRPIAASVSSATLVTLTLHAAPWRDALDYLVRAHHLVRRNMGRVILIEEPPHNRLEAQGASPSSWFLLLARQGGFSIIVPGNLPGTIDASLQDVRYEDALRATAREQGLEVEPVR